MAAPITTVAEGISRMEASSRDRSSVPGPGSISTTPGMKSNSSSSNTTDSGSAAAMSSRSWRQLPWIVGINLVAFGAHLCACGCFVYLPPMLRKAGFSEKSRGVILGLGPFLCIVGVPLVGAWSDRCRSRLGRRRPFLLGLGLLLALALASIAFIDLISATTVQGPVLAAATIVLDFATQERAVFILMLIALTSCLAVTFVLAKEKPLPPVKATEAVVNGDAVRPPPPCALVILDKAPQGGVAGSCLPVVCNGNGAAIGEPGTPSHNHSPLNGAGVFITWHHVGSSKAKATPATVLRALSSALLVLVCEAFCRVFVVIPARAVSYLLRIPINLRRLFLFQLLSWMALFAHYIYFTDFTGEVIYHGRPEETASNDDRSRYDRGVRAGSWGLLVNCIASSMYSLTIQWRVTSRFGQRFGLLLGIGTFAIAMAGLLVFTDLVSMLSLSALTGIAAAALDSIPYALACLYCENSQEYFKGSRYTPGVGQCLALLATAEYLSQVILTFLMGYIFSVTHTVASYVAVAFVCALASCYASMFVVCPSPKDTS
nr:membrane-associated transporter protein-like isoform X2 [Dermacentor andersoni]